MCRQFTQLSEWTETELLKLSMYSGNTTPTQQNSSCQYSKKGGIPTKNTLQLSDCVGSEDSTLICHYTTHKLACRNNASFQVAQINFLWPHLPMQTSLQSFGNNIKLPSPWLFPMFAKTLPIFPQISILQKKKVFCLLWGSKPGATIISCRPTFTIKLTIQCLLDASLFILMAYICLQHSFQKATVCKFKPEDTQKLLLPTVLCSNG